MRCLIKLNFCANFSLYENDFTNFLHFFTDFLEQHYCVNYLLYLLSWFGFCWCTRGRCLLLKIIKAFIGLRILSLFFLSPSSAKSSWFLSFGSFLGSSFGSWFWWWWWWWCPPSDPPVDGGGCLAGGLASVEVTVSSLVTIF